MRVFTFVFEWDQEIREFIYQDESRIVGKQRVQSTAIVVAPTEEVATRAIERSFKAENLEIKTITSVAVNIFCTEEFKAINTVGVDMTKPIRA